MIESQSHTSGGILQSPYPNVINCKVIFNGSPNIVTADFFHTQCLAHNGYSKHPILFLPGYLFSSPIICNCSLYLYDTVRPSSIKAALCSIASKELKSQFDFPQILPKVQKRKKKSSTRSSFYINKCILFTSRDFKIIIPTFCLR